MKRFISVVPAFIFLISGALFSQSVTVNDGFQTLGSWQAAGGTWEPVSGGLVQKDSEAMLAKINRPILQSGVMQYEFDVDYVSGGYKSQEDLSRGYFHGGFGIHIGIDKAADTVSWGNGRSYLLWLNMDTRPETKKQKPEHYGFRAQVYKSTGNSDMSVMKDYNIALPMKGLSAAFVSYTIHVRIIIDSTTGLVKVYDPVEPDFVYTFRLDGNLKGSWVSLRTNSVAMKFSNFTVTKK